MKVGDYVRTKYGIAKYIKDRTTKYGMYYVVDKDIMTCNVEGWENCISGSNEIIKSSPNIIDLIEIGDYVNGCPVLHKENNELVCGLLLRYKEENIQNVVTKEQFESMEYKVKE